MNESQEMRGRLTVRLTDRAGDDVMARTYANLIVRSGRLLVAQMFAGPPAGPPPGKVTHIAVGTGADPPADGQTALSAERPPRMPIAEIVYADIDEPVPGGGGATVKRVKASLKVVYDFADANGPEPLREAGIFTADVGGVMYNRVVFDPVIKNNTFKLTLLWDVVF